MIARGLSSGTICLGCRLRLLHQATRPNLLRSSPSRAPILNRTRSRRWFASEGAARPDGLEVARSRDDVPFSKGNSKDESIEPQNKEEFFALDKPKRRQDHGQTSAMPQENNYRAVKKLTMRKRHFSKGVYYREESERLDLPMLGESAKVIVLRGNQTKKKKNVYLEAEDAKKENELLELEALLDEQLIPPTDAEVHDNLNELRPKSEIYLSEKEFRKIQHELEDGFLGTQLAHYLATFKAENGERVPNPTSAAIKTETLPDNEAADEARLNEREDFVPKFKWIKSYSPWIPLGLDQNASGVTDRHLHGYLSPSSNLKERLAVRIMRECWGLHMEELIRGLGEVKLVVADHEFVLLMRGTRRFLKLLNDLYLEPDERIEAIRSKNTVRIVAARPKTQTIINELDVTLKNIKTESFDVSHVTSDPRNVDEALLEQVGHLTNTHVRLSSTKGKVSTSYRADILRLLCSLFLLLPYTDLLSTDTCHLARSS
jgi:hypothetical protein